MDKKVEIQNGRTMSDVWKFIYHPTKAVAEIEVSE
jgi:hypothetical protein